MGNGSAAARLARLAREMAREAEAALELFGARRRGRREKGESARERFERACARAAVTAETLMAFGRLKAELRRASELLEGRIRELCGEAGGLRGGAG